MSDGSQQVQPQTMSELVDRMLELLQLVDEAEGELTPEIDAALTEIAGSMDRKAEALSAVYRRLKGDEAANAALAEHYGQRARRSSAQAERLRTFMLESMTRLGVKKLGGPTGRAYVQASPPKLVLKVPAAQAMWRGYVRRVESVDNERLKADVEAGNADAMELAELQTGSHVRFR
jgi:hypothetical protein